MAAKDKPYSPSDLYRKLRLVWGDIGHRRIIPMGKGYFSFSFTSDVAFSRVWEKGAIALKPGILRFMRWAPNFSPANQKNTNAQVWVNFWDLGLEFWEPLTLFEIANGIGVPVKIDQNTLDRKLGLFARVLVDIDLSSDPPHELAVHPNNGDIVVIEVGYERLPDLCSHCGNVGHNVLNTEQVDKGRKMVVAPMPSVNVDAREGPSLARASPPLATAVVVDSELNRKVTAPTTSPSVVKQAIVPIV
ncbi:uncharacterized protein LOC112192433 [Rosa chinensis]|uniref:uncharacterized protein LOC112192433 n=1 Tax=Rosa chinensis TaxID=74649 RepID=UPI000D08BC76|nr:uncharacterized protein LOC112192433 [Rosa chinensis]